MKQVSTAQVSWGGVHHQRRRHANDELADGRPRTGLPYPSAAVPIAAVEHRSLHERFAYDRVAKPAWDRVAEVTGQSVDAMASLIACASLSRSDLSRSGDSALMVQPSPA